MSQIADLETALQTHADFLAGGHDFQGDISMLATSELVGTILETAMLASNMRFAAVARVTGDRWVACRTVDEINFGMLEGDEIEINSTFCRSVRDTAEMVIFNDVNTDEVYQNHPIAAKFGIVSYASIPIYRTDKSFFGTLCVIDTEPRNVKNPKVVAMLKMFADVIGQSLETEERLEAQTRKVEEERKLSRVQEEFVAVLGHDLRNPVAAFGSGLRQLSKLDLPPKANQIVPMMQSSLYRMNDLIENILLHAKARMGGGIQITATPDAPLAEAIEHVVEEVRMASPEREINLDIDIRHAVSCDAPRIAQAVANLVSNAVRHGTPGTPINVRGTSDEREVSIAITNEGQAVPETVQQSLFQPFQRGAGASDEGLGLGLYIASTIATAHNGRIEVETKDAKTTFAFKLPLGLEAT
ncbi:sensor histidine kinase [Thalassorhabdomicrobium marinisediminis]|uniref:sensor histidine kinase n=1 Tax=Thalassorhabdomicrobium marinisediminis TaxID=2170577 RepID=UPI002491AAF0|nr:GAF domain-containing sensor histidine kinase [Thalassorhabdomicrobium marinisediminis]